MKQWSKDDLILLYYGELKDDESKELAEAVAESPMLRQQYTELCEFLDTQVSQETPVPDDNLNQRILAAVYQQSDQHSTVRKNRNASIPGIIQSWFNDRSRYRFAGAFLAMSFVFVGVFTLGRWSVDPVNTHLVQAQFANVESNRVLFSSVSDHLEASSRLLRSVSNGVSPRDSELQNQHLKDLLALNRMYRRVIEQKKHRQLSFLLQQMETILIELIHAEGSLPGMSDIRGRLEESDLIYRLKVSNKKLSQKITYI